MSLSRTLLVREAPGSTYRTDTATLWEAGTRGVCLDFSETDLSESDCHAHDYVIRLISMLQRGVVITYLVGLVSV